MRNTGRRSAHDFDTLEAYRSVLPSQGGIANVRGLAGLRLVLTNKSDLAHNIALRGPKLAKPRLGKIVGKGRKSVVAFSNLPPGKYLYCSVFGHEAGGMKGTLTVAKRPT